MLIEREIATGGSAREYEYRCAIHRHDNRMTNSILVYYHIYMYHINQVAFRFCDIIIWLLDQWKQQHLFGKLHGQNHSQHF